MNNFKPTATVGPTVTTPTSCFSCDPDTHDPAVAYFQTLSVEEKGLAMQEYANRLRVQKMLALKHRQNGFSNTPAVSSKALTPTKQRLNASAPPFVPTGSAFPLFSSNGGPAAVNECSTTSEGARSEDCGGNSSRRAFASSTCSPISSVVSDAVYNGSVPDAVDSGNMPDALDNENQTRCLSEVVDYGKCAYDRDLMMKLKSSATQPIMLPEEFYDKNGRWIPDFWIKSVWKKEALEAGAESEDAYFRSRNKTQWGNAGGGGGGGFIPNPGFVVPKAGFIRRNTTYN